MKKVLVLLLAVIMVFSVFTACGPEEDEFKVGFIFLHDDKSTYDKNFMDAARAAQAQLGLKDSQVIFKDGVPEGEACYQTAADMVDQGCDVVFADSFGHEEWMIKAAKEFPEVQFCHATGVKAHTEKLANYHNAFANIYEGRYLAGIAAGMKLNEMIAAGKFTAEEAVIGYVGAWPYAEVKSGYTSFFLGARSVCPTATMLVDFTNSWFDVDAERDVANAMIGRGCKLISQHADSMGAPSACEEKSIPDVSYNGSTKAACPNTYIVSSRIDWTPYFVYMIQCVQQGKAIDTDWCGTLETGSVALTEINETVAAKGTKEAIDQAIADLKAGKIHVFDTNNFTVNGEKVTTYKADVDDMGDFVGETEVIKDGYFHESEYRSAPYFDLNIDGITDLSQK